MIIHDYSTCVSCEICSEELSVPFNWGVRRMRQYAKKFGWRVLRGQDICPKCAEKEEKKND